MSTTVTIPALGTRGRLAIAGVATAGLLVIAGLPSLSPRSSLAVDPTTPNPHTIAVSGTGRVVLSPDVADVQLGVTVTRSSVKAARADAATAMTAVLAALRSAGIADKDLKTSILSLQPQYDYSNSGNPPRLTGYIFSNAVSATVRNLDSLGGAIDGALAAGATSLDGVNFRVDDETKAEAQARTAAMADAKGKADALASAAGVSITGVASIVETVAPTPNPIPYAADSAVAGAPLKSVPTPVQAGTAEVSVTVAVTYLIP
ncbi:MAG: SIMPL domain-containing protein [Candidatus Limnocylindrales bacterium]